MHFLSVQAFASLPVCGLILEPNWFCGHTAQVPHCGRGLSLRGVTPSSDEQAGASASWSGFHEVS